MTTFLFPGQGSQFPGMGRELTAFGSRARALIDTAEQATGLPLLDLMDRADAARIADPHTAQVLVFVWSSVALRDLTDRGLRPDAVAGHSLGEYTALVACGALDWIDALALVSARGRAMAAAASRRPGAMGAVVGLDAETVRHLCADATVGDEVAVVANLNSARQFVVSGTMDAVTAVLAAASAAGALRARRLPVGGAYHSPLMRGAEDALAPLLRGTVLRAPRVPMVSSMTGAAITDITGYADALTRQITSPVRWLATVGTLADETDFVEVGPGRVLAGLGRETLRAARHRSALAVARPRVTAGAA
ncbi:ACP S-malonyltransferase [Micromonospora sp. DT31]|uniref:ACP S-malonyltransferase n=1 Tax=Micromonospora sp. DT31 TaxID=3393434 RepID=UPI003CF766D8